MENNFLSCCDLSIFSLDFYTKTYFKLITNNFGIDPFHLETRSEKKEFRARVILFTLGHKKHKRVILFKSQILI